MARLPTCTPAQTERLERCIQQVKASGADVNPWAVCQAAIGCARPRQGRNARQAIPSPAEAAGILGKIEAMVQELRKEGIQV
mgnify:CR=1 FL=1